VAEVDAVIATLKAAQPRLSALLEQKRTLDLSAALNTVDTQLLVFTDERAEIDKARRNATDAQRAAALAGRANLALDDVRVHFAGHARITCEPERLRAIVARLTAIAEEMRDPAHAEGHAANIALIAERLPGLVSEADAIAQALDAAPARDIAHALGGAANRIFELYAEHFAGQARPTRNLRLLGDLCDRLASVRDQMARLGVSDDPINARNLPIVDSRLEAYEQEWIEIAKAKAAAQPQKGQDPLAGWLKAD